VMTKERAASAVIYGDPSNGKRRIINKLPIDDRRRIDGAAVVDQDVMRGRESHVGRRRHLCTRRSSIWRTLRRHSDMSVCVGQDPSPAGAATYFMSPAARQPAGFLVNHPDCTGSRELPLIAKNIRRGRDLLGEAKRCSQPA
jgi:hypothetical protein